MNIGTIKKKAQAQLNQLNEDKHVSMYRALLELRNATEKQLKAIKDKIKLFEKNPSKFVDTNEDLW